MGCHVISLTMEILLLAAGRNLVKNQMFAEDRIDNNSPEAPTRSFHTKYSSAQTTHDATSSSPCCWALLRCIENHCRRAVRHGDWHNALATS